MHEITTRKDKVLFFGLYTLEYTLAGFVSLLILNISRLFSLLEGASDVRTDSLSSYFTNATVNFASMLDKIPNSRTIFTFIFWLFVGLAVYIATMFAAMMVYNFMRDGNLVFRYHNPFGDTKSSVVKRVLVHWALMVMLFLLAVFMLLLLLGLIVPVSRELFMSGWYHPSQLRPWLYSAEAVGMVALGIASTIFTARLSWKVFKS